jgi:hypothetical protein
MCFVREYLWLGNDPRVKLSHDLSPTVPPYRHKDGGQARSAGKPTVGQLGLEPPNAPSNDFGGSVLSQSTEQGGDQGFQNRWGRAVERMSLTRLSEPGDCLGSYMNQRNNPLTAIAMHEKRSMSRCTVLIAFCAVVQYPGISFAQNALDSEKALRAVANAVVNDSVFCFVDQKTGGHFKSASEAPKDAQLRLVSPYADWRYWNGVLNIAMLRLGEALGEPSYSQFSRSNLRFAFDTYRYFEERYKGEGKWNYPFGQRFITEELDDCGPMGASVIEVYRHDPEKRYRDYIDSAANHILHRQSRLPDGTLVRGFPHKWTL